MLRLAVLLACAAACLAGEAEDAGIVPDLIDTAPSGILKVTFPNGVFVDTGNNLTPAQVAEMPSFEWPAESDAYYAILFVDPDAPGRANPTLRSYLHFLIGNILGNNTRDGTTLAPFGGSAPGEGTGPHRYTFLAYKQPRKMDFKMTPVSGFNPVGRANFTVRKFAQDNELGDPVAFNFYYCEFQTQPSPSNTATNNLPNVPFVVVFAIVFQCFLFVNNCVKY